MSTLCSGGVSLHPRELGILESQITRGRLEKIVALYTDPEVFRSRHVRHPDHPQVIARLLMDLHAIGKGRLWLRLPEYRFGGRKREAPPLFNVEAMLPGVGTSEVVIISAHMDSTADRDPSYRPERDPAPGADDDASGIAGVLAAARAILALSDVQPPDAPRAEIRFTLFDAEEAAQLGSRKYAKREKRHGTRISAVYQMDMIGYRHRADPRFEIHAGFNKNPLVQNASLDVAHHLVETCGAAQIPLTAEVYHHRPSHPDPGQGFSDHTSFHKHGYPAVLVSENFFDGPGSTPPPGHPNPDYHLPDDTIDNLDMGYAAQITRAVAAAAWHRATRLCCGQPWQAPGGYLLGGSRSSNGGNGVPVLNPPVAADDRRAAGHHHPAGHA